MLSHQYQRQHLENAKSDDRLISKENCSYQDSLERLSKHRQTLLSELNKEELSQEKQQYAQFVAHFEESIVETKANLELQSGHLKENLYQFDRHLLQRLISKEQLLKLYRFLKDVADQLAALQSHYDALCLEYKKLSIDSLLVHLSSIRNSFYQLVSSLNILIRANSFTSSPVYEYVYQQCKKWQGKLIGLFQEIFIWSFEAIRWPTIALVDDIVKNSSSLKETKKSQLNQLFVQLFCCLLELQTGKFRLDSMSIPENKLSTLEFFGSTDKSQQDGKEVATSFILHLPIKLMALPLIKRFNFHFIAEQSKLNCIEHPEWYLCQVEQWITRNEPFLSNTIDPILEEYFGEGQHCKSAKFQLTCHLLELVRTKLCHDVMGVADGSLFEEDDDLFSHTLDEVIIFNKQINYLVPGIFQARPELNPVAVLLSSSSPANDEVSSVLFEQFLRLEKSRLNELVDSIFQMETSWTVLFGGEDSFEEDDTEEFGNGHHRRLIVCEAADRFSLLLLNLVERSKFLTHRQHRLRVLHLLIDTVDDFSLRLTQVVHVYEERWPFTPKFYSILNTFGYLLNLVNEWTSATSATGGGSYFMQTLAENGQDLSVFSPTARTLQHMIEEIFERIENNIIADVTVDIIEYKKLNWHGMKLNEGDGASLSTSQAGATLLYHISAQTATLSRALSTDLFHSFLYDIAQKVQDLFFERIILEHYFNGDGARQLAHDITKGLFAVFALYLKNTEYTFAKLTDALLLLNCSSDTCEYLLELYNRNSSGTSSEMEFKQALQRQLGVYSLKPQTAYQLLLKRV